MTKKWILEMKTQASLWVQRKAKTWHLKPKSHAPFGWEIATDLSRLFGMESPTLIDVGGNEGQTIDYFLEYFPTCRIISFEPVQEPFQTLMRKYGSHPRITIDNRALSDESGEATIFLTPNSQANSLENRTSTTDPARPSQKVKVTTLDEIFDEHHLNCIDVLKIDVEGFEVQVLQGARKALQERKITAVFSEFTVDPGDRSHGQLVEIMQFLKPFNYHLVGFYDQAIHRNPLRLGYGNALFAAG